MRSDPVTIALLTAAVVGIAVAAVDAQGAPSYASLGAAGAGLAGLLLLLRETAPARSEPRAVAPGGGPTSEAGPIRFDRNDFARRETVVAVGNLRARALGPEVGRLSTAETERICGMPTDDFRAWVDAQLSQLEAAT